MLPSFTYDMKNQAVSQRKSATEMQKLMTMHKREDTVPVMLAKKRRSSRRRDLIVAMLVLALALSLGIFFWQAKWKTSNSMLLAKKTVVDGITSLFSQSARQKAPPPPVAAPPPQEKYVLRPHFVDVRDSELQKADSDMDACRLLAQCFQSPDSVYATVEKCRPNLDLTLRYYDSGFMVEQAEGKADRVVGFISIQRERMGSGADEMHMFMMWNVCIDETRRSRGLAKRMIPEFVEQVVQHYGLERFAWSKGGPGEPRPLLLGLDVEWPTPMPAETFSLYIKLGFVRWWEACASIAYYDWASLYKRHYTNRQESIASFPLANLIYNHEAYLKDLADKGKSGTSGPRRRNRKVLDHLCMFKFCSDSFFEWGREMRARILDEPSVLTEPLPDQQ